MAGVGLEPLERYPGSTAKWRCRCTRCGRQVTPLFSNVLRGKSSGCKYCSGHARTAEADAVALLREHGFEPLEPYPGLKGTPWHATCLVCHTEAAPRLQKLIAGEGGCPTCGAAKSAHKRRLHEREAAIVMTRAGLTPLVPYPGQNQAPWLCRCDRCGHEVSPTRGNISRGQGGCPQCGVKDNAARRLGDADQAVADMVAAGLLPVEPYPGVNKPWKAVCQRCADPVSPRLNKIRTRGGGCLRCGFASSRAKQMGDPGTAAAEMRRAGLEPLDPYPGAARPWRCRCLGCENEVTPRLQKIRGGDGGCRHCAAYGFNLTTPAFLYVLHHAGLGAVKVGISADEDRVGKFGRRGWLLIGRIACPTGAAAWTTERNVLRHIREELKYPAFLGPREMSGLGGWTETVDAEAMPADHLWSLATSLHRQLHGEYTAEDVAPAR